MSPLKISDKAVVLEKLGQLVASETDSYYAKVVKGQSASLEEVKTLVHHYKVVSNLTDEPTFIQYAEKLFIKYNIKNVGGHLINSANLSI